MRDVGQLEVEEIDRMLAAMPLRYRESRFTLIGPAMMGLLIAAMGVAVLAMPALTLGLFPAWAATAIACAIGASIYLRAWVRWNSVELTVEHTHVSYRSGVLVQNTHVVALPQIVSVDISQQLGAQQFGVGSLAITTTGSETLHCPHMGSCREILYLITHLVDASRTLGPDGLAAHMEHVAARR